MSLPRRPARRSINIPVQNIDLDTFCTLPRTRLTQQSKLGREPNLDRQRLDWDAEVERFRKDFFKDTAFHEPEWPDVFPGFTRATETVRDPGLADRATSHVPPPGSFAAEFDLHGYKSEDVSLQTVGEELKVKAVRETNEGGSRYVNEFNKTVQLPPHVDVAKLVASFSEDGVLTVSMAAPPLYATLPPPQPPSYDAVATPTPSETMSDSTSERGSVG